MCVARPSRRIPNFIAIVFGLSLSLAVSLGLASCGVEEGYESLEVRYEGVPINLEAAVEGETESALEGSSGSDVVARSEPETLSYADEAEPADGPETPATDIPEPADGGEIERQAHWEPALDEEFADSSEASAGELPDGVAVSESDANAQNRLRALQSFRGLVANATTLGSRSVDCIVEHVANSGVNPKPMNRVLRRALSGDDKEPSQRYVALAYDAANSCGVALSEGLLR